MPVTRIFRRSGTISGEMNSRWPPFFSAVARPQGGDASVAWSYEEDAGSSPGCRRTRARESLVEKNGGCLPTLGGRRRQKNEREQAAGRILSLGSNRRRGGLFGRTVRRGRAATRGRRRSPGKTAALNGAVTVAREEMKRRECCCWSHDQRRKPPGTRRR